MSEQEKNVHPPLPQEGELTEEALEQTAGGTVKVSDLLYRGNPGEATDLLYRPGQEKPSDKGGLKPKRPPIRSI